MRRRILAAATALTVLAARAAAGAARKSYGARALELGKPHFPSQGSERWYELHLTIPGKLDVFVAALQGAPVINIGFTRGAGWSQTASTARRSTPYELDLRRGRPTVHVVERRTVKMRRRTVRGGGGGVGRHPFYETRCGPILSSELAGNLSAELARGTTVSGCQASGRAHLAEACTALAVRDTRADVGSRGAVLWRELWSRLPAAGVPWTLAYDPNDPVATPRAIDGRDPRVLTALTRAVEDLRAKGIPLAELQAEPRGRERIPIHACSEGEGGFDIVTADRDAAGRYDPRTGASSIMPAAFDSHGVPRGEALLSYSQSDDPSAPHYADRTRLYSGKQWLPMRLTERQIRSDPEYERTVVTGRR